MFTKPIPRRRFLLSLFSVIAASQITSSVSAGDFRHEPTMEKTWNKNLIRSIQRKLSENGFDVGPADGIPGPNTKKGIKDFQRSKGLNVDGEISDQLIRELELG